MKYRKIPLEVQALQWTGKNIGEMLNFLGDSNEDNGWTYDDKNLYIHTLEGIMTAKKGCYIVIGVENELYPVEEGIFYKTYEKVD